MLDCTIIKDDVIIKKKDFDNLIHKKDVIAINIQLEINRIKDMYCCLIDCNSMSFVQIIWL